MGLKTRLAQHRVKGGGAHLRRALGALFERQRRRSAPVPRRLRDVALVQRLDVLEHRPRAFVDREPRVLGVVHERDPEPEWDERGLRVRFGARVMEGR